MEIFSNVHPSHVSKRLQQLFYLLILLDLILFGRSTIWWNILHQMKGKQLRENTQKWFSRRALWTGCMKNPIEKFNNIYINLIWLFVLLWIAARYLHLCSLSKINDKDTHLSHFHLYFVYLEFQWFWIFEIWDPFYLIFAQDRRSFFCVKVDLIERRTFHLRIQLTGWQPLQLAGSTHHRFCSPFFRRDSKWWFCLKNDLFHTKTLKKTPPRDTIFNYLPILCFSDLLWQNLCEQNEIMLTAESQINSKSPHRSFYTFNTVAI